MTEKRPRCDAPPPGSTAVRRAEGDAIFRDARAMLLHVETAHVRSNP